MALNTGEEFQDKWDEFDRIVRRLCPHLRDVDIQWLSHKGRIWFESTDDAEIRFTLSVEAEEPLTVNEMMDRIEELAEGEGTQAERAEFILAYEHEIRGAAYLADHRTCAGPTPELAQKASEQLAAAYYHWDRCL